MTEATSTVKPGANAANNDAAASERKLTMMVYICQGAGFIVGITFIAAIIINLIKKSDLTTDLAKSHMSWQLRTGLWSMLWSFIGVVLSAVLIGYLVLAVNVFWTLYRVIRGAMALNDNKLIGKQ